MQECVETTHGECDTLKALMTIVINSFGGTLGCSCRRIWPCNITHCLHDSYLGGCPL